jgi:hypothetical protein
VADVQGWSKTIMAVFVFIACGERFELSTTGRHLSFTAQWRLLPTESRRREKSNWNFQQDHPDGVILTMVDENELVFASDHCAGLVLKLAKRPCWLNSVAYRLPVSGAPAAFLPARK